MPSRPSCVVGVGWFGKGEDRAEGGEKKLSNWFPLCAKHLYSRSLPIPFVLHLLLYTSQQCHGIVTNSTLKVKHTEAVRGCARV